MTMNKAAPRFCPAERGTVSGCAAVHPFFGNGSHPQPMGLSDTIGRDEASVDRQPLSARNHAPRFHRNENSLRFPQVPILAIRWVSLETLRLAVFLWMTPVRAARNKEGSAATKAACAADLSPLAIAASTLRSDVRIRERRALFISVRRAILRVAFLADLVLAIVPFLDVGVRRWVWPSRSTEGPEKKRRRNRRLGSHCL